MKWNDSWNDYGTEVIRPNTKGQGHLKLWKTRKLTWTRLGMKSGANLVLPEKDLYD